MTTLSASFVWPLEIKKEETELKIRSLTIKRWLRTDEVALYLGASKMAVKHMVLRGKLAPTKFCGRLYFNREELDRLIENSGSRRKK
ncbi:MAG: helix-turn-helix domain-containing protein [Pseudobdellovibrio sp.]